MTYLVLRLGVVGTGRVARMHLRAIASLAQVHVSAVAGRTVETARELAGPVGADALDDVASLAGLVDGVIVASPTACHVEHGTTALRAGRATLVELPVAESLAGAEAIATTADGSLVVGAHTSRWLPAIARIGEAIRDGRVGDVRRVSISRSVAPRERSWVDDPLLHHGQHAVDIVRSWLGDVEVLGASATDGAVEFSLAAGETLVDASIVHDAPADEQSIRVIGSRGSLTSDGFGVVRGSGGAGGIELDVSAEAAYARSVLEQDRAFVDAIRFGRVVTPFTETLANVAVVEAVRRRLGHAA